MHTMKMPYMNKSIHNTVTITKYQTIVSSIMPNSNTTLLRMSDPPISTLPHVL